MGKAKRIDIGGMAYHVLNRANGKKQIFKSAGDYRAFETTMIHACEKLPMRILAYCIMPNHWHFVLWPKKDGDLSTFMHWLSLAHAQRWHAFHGTTGTGHLYQGRYKSFLIQKDGHLLTVCRYVERNALRARLVNRAEAWRWGSLWWHAHGCAAHLGILEDTWPVPRPPDWLSWVNQGDGDAHIDEIRDCLKRTRPFGAAGWVLDTAERFGIGVTLRPRGRPARCEPTKDTRLTVV